MALARVDAMVNRGQMQRESRNSRLAGFTVNSLLFPWSHSFSLVSVRGCDSQKKFTVLFTVKVTDLNLNSEKAVNSGWVARSFAGAAGCRTLRLLKGGCALGIPYARVVSDFPPLPRIVLYQLPCDSGFVRRDNALAAK
jgi:hypothetical protein